MFSILDRYIGRTIFSAIAMTLLLLVSLSTIIRFIDQLRRVKEAYTTASAGLYSILLTPTDIEVFFPMAALLGSLIGLGLLASKSELVVMEIGGFSRMRIAKAVMKTAIPLVILTMAIGEWVAPVSEQTARNMRSEKLYGSSLIASKSSIWAKDGDDFIHIYKVNNDNSISGINIYSIKDNRLVKLTYATYAYYEDNSWTLVHVEESNLMESNQISGSSLLNKRWDTNITPEKLGVVALDPQSLSATGLYQYINYLESTGQDSLNYELIFWQKIFKPLSVAVMMLMALSFIFGPLRSVPMGVRVVTGITFGFIFYVSDMVFSKMSVVAGFNPILGALLTSIVFLTITFYMLKKKR